MCGAFIPHSASCPSASAVFGQWLDEKAPPAQVAEGDRYHHLCKRNVCTSRRETQQAQGAKVRVQGAKVRMQSARSEQHNI